MTARVPLSRERIVEEALAILDEEGAAALTTRNVTSRLGVTQPALYSHVATVEQLRALVAAHGSTEQGEVVRAAAAGRTGIDALRAAAHAYRDYVAAHPDRYLVQVSTAPTDETRAALEEAAQGVRDVLRSFGIPEADVPRAHVAFRSAIHGFVHLEARRASSSRDSDGDFEYFIDLFAAGLTALHD